VPPMSLSGIGIGRLAPIFGGLYFHFRSVLSELKIPLSCPKTPTVV
jgi:hypothetical protein